MQAYETAAPRQGIVRGEMQEPPASEEPEQTGNEQLQRIVLGAMKIIYTKSTSDGVVRMLRGKEPVQSLAQTTLFVMKALYDASKGTVPTNLIAPAAKSVTDLLAELAQAAGVKLSPQQVEQASGIVQARLQSRFGRK